MLKRGFTMVELIIVVAIIAVLASIIMPKMTGARDKAKIKACIVNLKTIGIAMETYNNENGCWYPDDGLGYYCLLPSCYLIVGGYLRSAPKCPSTPYANSWSYCIDKSYAPFYIYCHPYWTPGGSQPTHNGSAAYRPVYYPNGRAIQEF